jgi:hypothetical protein
MVEILSGTDFFTQIISLAKPLIDAQTRYVAFGGIQCMIEVFLLFFSSFHTEPVSSFGSTGATALAPLLEKFGFTLPAIQYLYNKYQKLYVQP